MLPSEKLSGHKFVFKMYYLLHLIEIVKKIVQMRKTVRNRFFNFLVLPQIYKIKTEMKKLCMIVCLAFLWSCGNSVPKCDDPQVIKTVKEIILDNFEDKMKESLGGLAELSGEDNSQKNKNLTQKETDAEIEREKEKAKRKSETDISNIITNEVDEKLKSCGCEGTFNDTEVGLFAGVPFEGTIIKNGDKINYTVKTDSEGNIMVEVIIY